MCDACWRTLRNLAHRIYKNARRRGDLAPPTLCEVCGGSSTHGVALTGHHPDYRQPLLIVWCHPAGCHRRLHREERLRHERE